MSSKEFENISFDLPKNQSNVIKVIGVGGGGSNAINHMFQQGIKGVDFVICNTDAQALENSPVPNKIQLGVSLTEGLGAGANPHIGQQAAVESFEEIKGMLNTSTKMIFITAGMGGGTGTGAAPIIAKQAKEMGVLTVGIITIPFQFEGKMRCEQAQLGVENLRNNVDSLIVINNNKLREVYGNLGFKAGFSKADEVLATASRGIAEVITHHYTQNIDLRDAKTVLSNSGTAIMGSAHATGSNRAHDAITKALDSPLLNDNKITGAKNVLLLIVSGSEEITIDEIGEINDHIQAEAGHSANIIMGVGEDDDLNESIAVTIIATGFDVEQQNEIVNTETKKIIHTLEDEQRAEQNLSPKKTSSYEEPKKEKIVHVLEEEPPMETKPDNNEIKDMDVSYEEVKADPPEEEFIITDSVKDMEVNEPEEVEQESQEQFNFIFDLPKNKKSTQKENPDQKKQENPQNTENKKVTHELTNDPNEIEVNNPKEVTPVPETTSTGEKRYSLDDYMELEDKLEKSKPTPPRPRGKKEEDPEMVKKTVREEEPEKPAREEEIDPFNSPLPENANVKERAAERREKMKEFNYKFRSNVARLEEIERQPAYKRAGIELDNSKPGEEKLSRTSLNSKDDDLDFRSNNSFLHDNVD